LDSILTKNIFNIKKIKILFFLFILCQSLFSQIKITDESNFYFKCGTIFGDKIETATLCAKKVKDINSPEFNNQYKYCICFLSFITKNFTYNEFNEILKTKKDFVSEIIKSKDKKLIDEIKICGDFILKEVNPTLNLTSDKKFDENFITICEYNVENTLGINKNEFNVKTYCECLRYEFKKNGLKIDEIKDIQDTNSVIYNEIISKCLNKLKVESSPEKTNDVISYNNSENINLINNKLKINIAGISKYFIIDSGASNISISTNLEKELLLKGIIKKEDYFDDEIYALADGSIIKCKVIIINNVGIGNFKVNNVKINIFSNLDNDLLLGKSFLDKFKKWTINNENSTLYLEKK
jgi:clan AA aspartic protease (TIGR02281 family)